MRNLPSKVGELPEFFASVLIEWPGENITFKSMIKDRREIELVFHSDGIVGRGEDYHYVDDCTILPESTCA